MKGTCLTQRPYASHPTQPIFHWNIGCVCYPTRRNLHKKKEMYMANARNLRHLTPEIPTCWYFAELQSFALGDAKVPNARYFAFWWNIGLRVKVHRSHLPTMSVMTNCNVVVLKLVSSYVDNTKGICIKKDGIEVL